jgi:exodeoxyribonuclease V beta subunit
MNAHYPRPAILDAITRTRHAVIDASAGTGKTYTIEHLVIELLLRHQVTLDQILVLTYTERAAEELRQRIRSKIEAVVFDPCDDEKCDHDTRAGVWWLDDKARGALRRALYSFDAAAIGTIHGFFGRVLTEHAFASGWLFAGELADGRALFGHAFKTALRHSLAVQPGAAAELLAIWMGQATSAEVLDDLENQLYRCHSSRRVIEPAVSLDALRREIHTSPLFELALAAETEDFAKALKAAGVHHSTVKSIRERLLPNLQLAISRHGKSLSGLLGGEAAEAIRKIGECALKGKLAPGPASEFVAACAGLARRLVPLEAALVQIALPEVRKFLKREKALTGQFDYDDLIADVVDAVEGPHGSELIEALRRRFQIALIDEFQDTDELQWKFFDHVFVQSAGRHRAYLIGDPKQAIYAFRGGDVFAYLQARELVRGPGSPVVPLEQNFRSTRALIDAYNRIFAQDADPPFFQGEILYDQPVTAGNDFVAEEPLGIPSPPIYLLKIEPKSEELGMSELRRGLARQIAREVKKLITGPGLYFGEEGKTERINPRDIYILCATNANAIQVSQSLRAADVPFSFFKQDGLFETDEARHVCDLLAAIDQPDDRSRRGRAWITPFFDVPLEVLPRFDDLPESHPLFQRLTAWNDLARRRRFEALFRRILDESGILLRELFLKDNERALTNYFHLFEILLEEARASGCALAGLVTTLNAYIRGIRKPPGEDSDVQRLESDRDAVQIMTIHKSKGLEAAVVFVFGGFFARSNGNRHEYHDDQGRRVLYLGDAAMAKEAAAAETAQERERLFYVALTRAKARLYLPMVSRALWKSSWTGGYKRVNDRLCALESRLPQAEFARHFRVIPFQDRALGSEAGDQGQPSPDVAAWRPPRKLAEALKRGLSIDFNSLRKRHAGYEVTSYSRMKGAWDSELLPLEGEERDREPVRAPETAPQTEGAMPGGTGAGTCLHEILELAPFDMAARAASYEEWIETDAIASVVDDALAHNGIDPIHRTAAAEMAYLGLTRAISLGDGRLIPGFCRCTKYLREMEFLFPLPEASRPSLTDPEPRKLAVERGFIKGFVDLVVEHEGLVYFADWKSDVLDSYDPEPLARHIQERYALQARLYALALVKALRIRSAADYRERFGGLVYVFLRGLKDATPTEPAVYFNRPEWSDILAYQDEVKRFGSAQRGGRA